MPVCEIIYVKEAKGWKWRTLAHDGEKRETSAETYLLFYECVAALRARGYTSKVKYL
jgi:hypothetical protein